VHSRLVFAPGDPSRRPGDIVERPSQPNREKRSEQQADDGGDPRCHEKYGNDAVVEHRARGGGRLPSLEHQAIEGGLRHTQDTDRDNGQRHSRHQQG